MSAYEFRHSLVSVARKVHWHVRQRYWPHWPMIIRDRRRGLRMALPPTGNAAVTYYRWPFGSAMGAAIEHIVTAGDVVIDVGANIGEFTLLAASRAGPEGRVYALEPAKDNVGHLCRNVRINGFRNVTILRVAAMECRRTVAIETDRRSGGARVTSTADGGEVVEATTLDDLIAQVNTERIKLAKIDAAGAELLVLQGGQRSLAAGKVGYVVVKLYQPRITIERFGYHTRETVHMLAQLGYQTQLLSPEVSSEDDAVAEWLRRAERKEAEYGAVVLAYREASEVVRTLRW